MGSLDAYVVCPPGVEAVTAAELRGLGVECTEEGTGGLAVDVSLTTLYRLALQLRTASRILVRLARFRARDFQTVERHAARLTWDRFSRPGDPIRIQASSKKSRLYHQRAIVQRFSDAARAAGRDVVEGSDEDPAAVPAQRLVVRLFRDRCTVSVDATGEHLHRRGYRKATGKAPLRETLAAAALLATGWDGTAPLVDPMCGSGTLVVEGALIARHMAPGRHRTFAFQQWPDFETTSWSRVLVDVDEDVLAGSPVPLLGSDRNAGAVEAAGTNAERAGVSADTRFGVQALSAADAPPGPPGLLMTNPPYGARLGTRSPLRDLYAALGNVARARFGGWTLALVCSDPMLVGQVGLDLEPCLATRHGGIGIKVWKGLVPG